MDELLKTPILNLPTWTDQFLQAKKKPSKIEDIQKFFMHQLYSPQTAKTFQIQEPFYGIKDITIYILPIQMEMNGYQRI